MHMLHCYCPFTSDITFDPQESACIFICMSCCCTFLWCTVRNSHSSEAEFDVQHKWVTPLLVPVCHSWLLQLSCCTFEFSTCSHLKFLPTSSSPLLFSSFISQSLRFILCSSRLRKKLLSHFLTGLLHFSPSSPLQSPLVCHLIRIATSYSIWFRHSCSSQDELHSFW